MNELNSEIVVFCDLEYGFVAHQQSPVFIHRTRRTQYRTLLSLNGVYHYVDFSMSDELSRFCRSLHIV